MIKGIFFDAADVFYRRPERTEVYVSGLLTQHGARSVLSQADQARQVALLAMASTGHVTPAAYWDQDLVMHGLDAPAQRERMVSQIIAYSDRVVAIPGGREAVAGLKQRGFVLGIVTDTIYPLERKMRWLAQVGVAEFIDVVACSSVLGTRKPAPAIYANALQQARLTPSEAAFVGHDAGELEGARKAGMATVAVNHDPDAMADYYAGSLMDLLKVPIFQLQHVKGGRSESG
jgi:HAD superfamily hydrolase (TIGR01509 family)